MPVLQSPLIPLPTTPNDASTSTRPKQLDHDPYSPLFQSPSSSNSIFKTQSSNNTRHEARPSLSAKSDSDFGSFISVPASHHPLEQFHAEAADSSSVAESASSFGSFTLPTTDVKEEPATRGSAFRIDDGYFELAKHRSQENHNRLLSELLEHEDDPLYWLNISRVNLASQNEVDPLATPSQENPMNGHAEGLLVDVDSSTTITGDASAHSSSPVAIPSSPRSKSHQTRRQSSTSPPLFTPTSPSSTLLSRKSSLPTLSSSVPEEPIHDPMSMSLTMPHSPQRSARQLLGTISSSTSIPQVQNQSQIHPPNRQQSSPSSITRNLSSSFFNTFGTKKAVTHHTPFARDVFIPPTGAPGFTGDDHSWNTKGFEFDQSSDSNHVKQTVKLTGLKEITTPVLTSAIASSIRPNLPALAKLSSSWSLLYSLDQHGISLHTFYQQCSKHDGGTVVVVQDAEGGMFGAWISEPLTEHVGAYYGSGDAFLWKCSDPTVKDPSLEVFKWTGKNEYVALCESDSVSFGGGDGHYGLYISSSLISGSSASCPTFDNEILCSHSCAGKKGRMVEFECVGIEVWGVKLGG